jgi:hypothetical protein
VRRATNSRALTSPPPQVPPPPAWRLEPGPLGELHLVHPDGRREGPVVPVRAFPISEPGRGVSLVGPDGHERAWIDRLDELPAAWREPIEQELAAREFVPEIRRLLSVSTFATPSVWQLETDRGPTQLVLRGEEDIRRVPGGALMVTDTHGVAYLIRRVADLDRHSKRLLERFL